MNKAIPIVMSALVLVLAGCKSTAPASEAKDKVSNSATAKTEKTKEDLGIRCRAEAPTGSRLKKMKCTTRKQRQARSETKRVIDDVVRNQIGKLKGPIGGGN